MTSNCFQQEDSLLNVASEPRSLQCFFKPLMLPCPFSLEIRCFLPWSTPVHPSGTSYCQFLRRVSPPAPICIHSLCSGFTVYLYFLSTFSSVQWLSCVQLFATPWITARQASLSIINSQSSLRLMSIESVMPSSHLILCRPLLLLPPIPPSIRVFSNESTLRMRWPKYWSFNFSIIPSKEIPGLIFFRMDWLDLLAVQGTLKSLLHTTVQKRQFSGAQLSSQSNSHIHRWPLEKP